VRGLRRGRLVRRFGGGRLVRWLRRRRVLGLGGRRLVWLLGGGRLLTRRARVVLVHEEVGVVTTGTAWQVGVVAGVVGVDDVGCCRVTRRYVADRLLVVAWRPTVRQGVGSNSPAARSKYHNQHDIDPARHRGTLQRGRAPLREGNKRRGALHWQAASGYTRPAEKSAINAGAAESKPTTSSMPPSLGSAMLNPFDVMATTISLAGMPERWR